MQLAPISLFVYNRLSHTEKTIEALKKNTLAAESDLIIFSDGPKENLTSQQSVIGLREYLKTITGFRSIRIVERKENFGLAQSIITGVSEIVNKYGRIIVLEDDIVTSRYFLEYMNQGLELYKDDPSVISVHSYVYPVKGTLPETFFLRGSDCFGWATWKRGWDIFEPDGNKLLSELRNKKLLKEFDFAGSYPFTKMLKNQIAGNNNSWAIRWYASAFLKNKLTLYPGESLIYNIGFDGSGENCEDDSNFNKTDKVEDIRIKVKKIEINESPDARAAFINYFRSQTNIPAKALKYLSKLSFKKNN